MFHGVESLKLQLYWNTRLLKGSRKRANSWVNEGAKSPKISDLQKYLKKQYDMVKELLNVTQQFYLWMEKSSNVSWCRKFKTSIILKHKVT